MGWRSIVISRPATLHREHYSLAIEQEQVAFVPFEDIAIIVLNHRDITLSHPVLSACADYGIGLYATGHNHQPNGVFLPFLSHTRTTRLLRQQLDLNKPLAKRTWASIIRQKIRNQAYSLRLANQSGEDWLLSVAERVRSGDSDNLEGQAAAYYFSHLFGQGFHRSANCWANAALDYGYAVLRGAIARGLVAHGMHPPIGLFHASEQNAFNLADDLIEPFRPLVDLHVQTHHQAHATELLPLDKAALVGLLNVDVAMPQGVMSALSAIEHLVESLARLFEQGDGQLALPELIGLKAHVLEC